MPAERDRHRDLRALGRTLVTTRSPDAPSVTSIDELVREREGRQQIGMRAEVEPGAPAVRCGDRRRVG